MGWQGCGEKGTLVHCWWECKLVQTQWKTVWRVLKKLKVELPYASPILLLGIYMNEMKKVTERENLKKYVIIFEGFDTYHVTEIE